MVREKGKGPFEKKEGDIQSEILTWLRHQFPLAFIRKVSVGSRQVGNGKTVPNEMAGFPDIMMLKGGVFYGIEVKRPKQKPDPHQEAVHQWLRDAGGIVYVVTSLEELRKAMGLG